MKYFTICMLGIWMMPFIGIAQAVDTVGFHEERKANDPFLSLAILEDRLYLDIPKTSMDGTILWTRVDDRNRYDYKQVTFRRSIDKIYMEEHRIWSETGIWLPLNGDRKLERNILGVFPVLRPQATAYRIDITDLLADGSLGWNNFPTGPKVPSLNGLEGTKQTKGEVMVKFNLGLAKKDAKIAQPVYFSFKKLAEPMEPRKFDYRMGYWIEDVGLSREHTKNVLGSIARWRLEKKYKDRETSVPVKPITYILSPEIPIKWRSYVKAGIEEWLPAFESAGFKEALVVKEVDTLDEWTEYGLGHSIVKWTGNQNVRDLTESITGSTVNRVVDLRSGEIIKSDILLGSPIEQMMDNYFVRCSPLDPRAQFYPFPDELVGELIQSLVAHETGHSFGISDNHYGEFSYPVEKMGDVDWLRQMGHTPSIMTYARHNNLAQPEDKIPPSLLIQKVGPTDHYYIQWGYSEFPIGISPKEKEDRLEEMIRWQDSVPWYRYINAEQEVIGPGATNEVVETNDPVQGAVLGLKNLERAIEQLTKINGDQKDNHRLERMYGEALEVWYDTMRNVLSMIGGYEVFYKSLDQPGKMYTPISKASQKEALDFLMEWAFNPPDWLTRPEFREDITYSSYPDLILSHQQLLVLELLRPKRMKRLEHLQTINGFEGSLKAYLVGLLNGIFKELGKDSGYVGARKQEIHMTYIDRMTMIIEKEREHYEAQKKGFDYSDYTKGLMMGHLIHLRSRIEKRINRDNRLESLGHWKLCLKKLDKLTMK